MMNPDVMSKIALVAGAICLVVAVVIFVSVDGLRRWYSGGFFVLIGTVMLVNAFRWHRTQRMEGRGSTERLRRDGH